MEKQNGYPIKSGPGKFGLMVALFDPPDQPAGRPRRVEFAFGLTGQQGGVVLAGINAIILSVQVEDGSRESWNITGYGSWDDSKTYCQASFRAHYNTVTRRGHLTFIVDGGGDC